MCGMAQKKSIKISIHTLPATDRPRERLITFGPSHLSNSELLALLFGRGSGKTSVLDLAHSLLSTYKSISLLSEASIQDLMRFKGLGLAKASQLIASFELMRRMENFTQQVVIQNPADVVRLIRPKILRDKRENFFLISLDSRNKCISIDTISKGTVNGTFVHPRETFFMAISRHAVHIIIVHNHPSDDCTPSEDDKQITRILVKAGKLLNIPVEDHIIVSNSDFFSFKKAGLLKTSF